VDTFLNRLAQIDPATVSPESMREIYRASSAAAVTRKESA
jgi:malonate decarboxylase beta subunit